MKVNYYQAIKGNDNFKYFIFSLQAIGADWSAFDYNLRMHETCFHLFYKNYNAICLIPKFYGRIPLAGKIIGL